MRILVGSCSATAGTRHLLGQAFAHLRVDHDRLHLLEQVLRFLEVQAERVHRQHIAVDLRHLVDSWRLVIIIVV